MLLERHHGAAAGGGAPLGPVVRDRRLARSPVASLAREEALEVAHPVAPIAARVDPVVAQPAGVAPRADRVRVHAQDLGGARHGQCRVERSRMEQVHLRQSGPREDS